MECFKLMIERIFGIEPSSPGNSSVEIEGHVQTDIDRKLKQIFEVFHREGIVLD